MTETIERTPVMPAIEGVVIEVTDEDIALGRRGNSLQCPTANALSRYYGAFASVDASAARVYSLNGSFQDVRRFKTSADLSAMIEAYDKGADFAPGLYTLTPFKS